MPQVEGTQPVARLRELAAQPGSVRVDRRAVGIRPGSVPTTIEALRDRADLIDVNGLPTITDPLFEIWLRRRGIASITRPTDEESSGSVG